MRIYYILFFSLFTGASFAQVVERIKVQGQITSINEKDIEGVTLYNNSSNKGVVTDAQGTFTLAVAKGDEIYVSAVQYAPFTLTIDASIIENKKLSIFLNAAVNQLSEVIVKRYDLSGNLIVDAQNIKVSALDFEWDLSWETLNFEYVFTDDQYSSIRGNVAEDALGINQMPMLGIDFIAIASLLFPDKKPSKAQKRLSESEKLNTLFTLYPESLILEQFNVPLAKAQDFLIFAFEEGFPSSYLNEENSFVLYQFLKEKAPVYLQKMKG